MNPASTTAVRRPPPAETEAREKTCWLCGKTFCTDETVCPADGARLVDLTIDDSHDPLIGHTLDRRYEVTRRLGEGGMGTVYAAWDPESGAEVAIKVLKADYLRDENIRRRFMHEARIVSGLEHPSVVKLEDFGQMRDGNFYMVMELLKGESLADRLAYKFLSYNEIFRLIPPICDALAEAHEKGVVHRDLKPENVFVIGPPGAEIPRLIDFGVAKQIQTQNVTRTGTLWGTPAYMSPEQARGDEIGAAADVYAVGTILYELICGHLPFQAESQLGFAMKHMHQPPRPMRSVPGLMTPPPELDALVMRALAKDPSDRPAGVRALAEQLRAIVAEHFTPELLAKIPAQEVDPVKLKEWFAEGAAIPHAERLTPPAITRSRATTPPPAASRARPRTLIVAGVAALLLIISLTALALIRSDAPAPRRPATISDPPIASPAALPIPDLPRLERPTERERERSEASAGAAGAAASRAASVMISATQLVDRLEEAAETAEEQKRGSARGRRARPKRSSEIRRDRKLKNALRNTF